MKKTKIQKAIAIASIAAIAATTLATTFASNIGTANVSGQAGTSIIWDNSFPGTATGTVSGVIVTAQVLPVLNMVISTGAINLGTLTAWVESSGSLWIEIGTNAANGITITARSGSGGLTNTSNNSLQMNNLTTDGIAESYTFASTAWANDSTISGFASTGDLTATEVNNNTTENIIYSTNKPEQYNNTNSDVAFTVATTSNAQTAAGNYEDNITFTVTGNF